MIRIVIISALLGFLAATARAGDADSTRSVPPADSLPADTTRPLKPSGAALTIEDSIHIVFPNIRVDTLNENQRMLVEFETRFNLKRREQAAATEKKPATGLSYSDSLAHYFVTPRWDRRSDIDRAFFHDAGDYFRFDPAFFRIDPQITPMRQTVRPYGLSGDRLGYLIGGEVMTPFEHVVEPDGSIDTDDFPTALDSTVAILPGPVGMLLGADHSTAALFTMPSHYDDEIPHSSMIVDKGAFGYAYTRGRFSKNFTSGKHVDMSIGYRNGDGSVGFLDDQAYHYTGSLSFNVHGRWSARARGHLYDRTGHYQVRPLAGGSRLKRHSVDRSGELSMQRRNVENGVRYEFGYRYLRQESSENGAYDADLSNFGRGLFATREWFSGRTAFRLSLEGNWRKYDDWYSHHERYSGAGGLEIARFTTPWRMALRLQQQYVDGYRFLPMAVGMIARESDYWYVMLSGGYSERAPSLYELYLHRQQANIYGSGTDYADQGNSDLISEKQLLASVELQLGSVNTNLTANVTGGRIKDGIDWQHVPDSGLTLFSPVNGDVDFATGTLSARLSLWNFFNLLGGGSYHAYDYAAFPDKAYSPKYEYYAGGELHWYWAQRLLHLYAYGEVTYVGPYHGYIEKNLGNQPVFNGKLSFGLRKFRFNWVFQNIFLQTIRSEDYFTEGSRFTYFNFTWDFID